MVHPTKGNAPAPVRRIDRLDTVSGVKPEVHRATPCRLARQVKEIDG